MKWILILLTGLLCLNYSAEAQSLPATQPFGEVDTADLKLTCCPFEKGANAMVLFDKADIRSSRDSVVMNRHKRIKIFTTDQKGVANIRIPWFAYRNFEEVSSIEAQTIYLENNKIVTIKLDPKQIYTETTDKNSKALVFALPNVKPGCIIEFKYKWKSISPADMPMWFFQSTLPVRYSELTTIMPVRLVYDVIIRGSQPFVADSTTYPQVRSDDEKIYMHTYAKANVHSEVIEPFMASGNMDLQSLTFRQRYEFDTWMGMASSILTDEDFGDQLKKNLSGQDILIDKANSFPSLKDRISYLFTTVQKTMKWNNTDAWYTDAGVRSAWSKKTGNSTEINLILYDLLKKANLTAYPMLVSASGTSIIPDYPNFSQIGKTVVYIPIDSARYYILDATTKYNVFNEVPMNMLNTYGLVLLPNDPVKCRLLLLKNEAPARQVILIDGSIKPDGKVTGTTVINNFSYNKLLYRVLYDALGETEYASMLTNKNDKLKISELKLANMEIDTLPLSQKFNFDLKLEEADANYVYFTPNLFTPFYSNPFLSEQRFSNIDFGSCTSYNINGNYKMTPGYKIDALPVSTVLNMYDKSIIFKRTLAEDDGEIKLHITLTYKRSAYGLNEYKALYDFYKKMYQMLNEPIVLKKIVN